MLKLHFSDIPDEGLHLSIDDATWFPEIEAIRRTNPETYVILTRSDERVFVEGSIRVTLAYQCDRCLEEFNCLQEISFRLLVEMAEAERGNSELPDIEYEYDPSQIEILYCENRLIDLGELLSQQVLLAIPLKNLCRDDCRGICERCGVDLNAELCSCKNHSDSSPFASLKKFRVKS
ncbi:MAG: DUF177 domain-containing protein [Desulfobulbaceae bacterium]|nr:DUF177 domain-containing protein [Desulfobulbaceae bacterium]